MGTTTSLRWHNVAARKVNDYPITDKERERIRELARGYARRDGRNMVSTEHVKQAYMTWYCETRQTA